MKITNLEKHILRRLQKGIPLIKDPWEKIAQDLNIKQNRLLESIAKLKKQGIIRRISATFNPRKTGLASTLVALKCAQGNVDKIAEKLNTYPEITHSYKRNNIYNLWFTLVAKNRQRILEIIKQIKQDKRVEDLLELPAIKIFKIDVNFKI